MGNLGARQHFLVYRTPRRPTESSTTPSRNTCRRSNHTHLGTAQSSRGPFCFHPPRRPRPPAVQRTPTDQKHPPTKNTHHPRTPTDQKHPPSENAKIHRPAPPATPGPAPASTTSIGSPFGTSPPCTGRRRPACKVPIMTAAHSGTPAAVFVCQHPHSTANLRQNQYPHPEMRKILAVCRTPARGQELRIQPDAHSNRPAAATPRGSMAAPQARTSENRHQAPSRPRLRFALAAAGARAALSGRRVGRPGLEPGTCGLRVRCSAKLS